MSEIDNGGPAFPHMKRPRPDFGSGVSETFTDGGMSLRDWFAGQALPAVITATAAGQHHPIPLYTGKGDNPKLEAAIARDAYAMADAMIEARKVKP
jgi:hypothetical protein